MLTAGKLNERVGIMNAEIVLGQFGEQVTTWKLTKTVWANVIFQRGAYALNAGEGWLTRSISVTMRNNRIVTDRSRLLWDGKTYMIESFNRSGSDGSITIVATHVDEGNNQATEKHLSK